MVIGEFRHHGGELYQFSIGFSVAEFARQGGTGWIDAAGAEFPELGLGNLEIATISQHQPAQYFIPGPDLQTLGPGPAGTHHARAIFDDGCVDPIEPADCSFGTEVALRRSRPLVLQQPAESDLRPLVPIERLAPDQVDIVEG